MVTAFSVGNVPKVFTVCRAQTCKCSHREMISHVWTVLLKSA